MDPAGSGQNGKDPVTDPAGSGQNSQDPKESGRNPTILAGSGQTCLPESGNGNSFIFFFCNFLVRTKRRKIFSRNFFFLKMISSKIFYDGNHFTSKQTKHKIMWSLFIE
jgi:hypothetical protein